MVTLPLQMRNRRGSLRLLSIVVYVAIIVSMSLSEKHKQKIREEEEYRAKVRKEVTPESSSGKSKVVAALLAFFLGDFGIHKFYLGKTGQGMIYLILTVLFFWTVIIPFIIAIICWIEAVIYLTMDDKTFAEKYK